MAFLRFLTVASALTAVLINAALVDIAVILKFTVFFALLALFAWKSRHDRLSCSIGMQTDDAKILFGVASDVVLYRSSTSSLQLNGSLTLQPTAALTAGTVAISGVCDCFVRVCSCSIVLHAECRPASEKHVIR